MDRLSILHIAECTVQVVGESIKNWARNHSLKICLQNIAKCDVARSHAKDNKCKKFNYVSDLELIIVEGSNWDNSIDKPGFLLETPPKKVKDDFLHVQKI